jgi:hypothetical protein
MPHRHLEGKQQVACTGESEDSFWHAAVCCSLTSSAHCLCSLGLCVQVAVLSYSSCKTWLSERVFGAYIPPVFIMMGVALYFGCPVSNKAVAPPVQASPALNITDLTSSGLTTA